MYIYIYPYCVYTCASRASAFCLASISTAVYDACSAASSASVEVRLSSVEVRLAAVEVRAASVEVRAALAAAKSDRSSSALGDAPASCVLNTRKEEHKTVSHIYIYIYIYI